jgi:hypothetical protein
MNFDRGSRPPVARARSSGVANEIDADHVVATVEELTNDRSGHLEPLRESCRLHALRGWSHVKHIEEVFAGGS